MKMKSITIHNFRSITESKCNLNDYTVLVGANNAGKSNFLVALRIFYEDRVKYNDMVDFPKLMTEDNESWIEIEYLLTDEEINTLKKEYRNPDNILKVRKYLKSDKDDKIKANQSNIYGYENGVLSTNLFYGAKNISQANLGSAIFIPEVTKTDETLKLTGPSPLRNIISFVMNKVVATSESFGYLNNAFAKFNTACKEEASKDGFSLSKLKNEINDSLKEWEVEFNLEINPARLEDIIKNLISHNAIDKSLNKEIDFKYLGQGLQRHLIYTLLKLSSQYSEKKPHEKKEFSPELTLLLFEEPEAFLHPGQQELLNSSLKDLSSEEGQQIIVSTHSPIYVSKNIEDISALIKLKRDNGITQLFQVSKETQERLTEQNNELAQFLRQKLDDDAVSDNIKTRIREIVSKGDNNMMMEEEAIRYLLWLDSERCSAFFADTVLICEGATEKVFIDYLIKNGWCDLMEKKVYVLDAMGKYNFHRYMNLFKELGIYHSVLADKDNNRGVHVIINQFIEDQKNDFTKTIDFFDDDIETFLEISKPPRNRNDKKPLNVMWHYFKDKISEDKIHELKDKVNKLI